MKTVIYRLATHRPAEAFAVLDLTETMRYAAERMEGHSITFTLQNYSLSSLRAARGLGLMELRITFCTMYFGAGQYVLAGLVDDETAREISGIFPPLDPCEELTFDQDIFYRELRRALGLRA